MNFFHWQMLSSKVLLTATIVSAALAASPTFNVSSNNTILQNLHALSMSNMNTSVSYISLLLGLNTSCTSQVTQLLNSSDAMNLTFFAPSDSAFNNITGWPDLGANFCDSCSSNSSASMEGEGGVGSSNNSSSSSCPTGCNSTALGFNATAPELAPCLSEILQYHLLNESLFFNDTRFDFLNSSFTNITVLPTYLNSSCLVHLSNSTNMTTDGTAGGADAEQSENQLQSNNQYLVFNITNNNSSSLDEASSMSSPFNITLLHGINAPANVTVFNIQSSNGVLHVVDAVLIPPANFSQTVNFTFNNMTGQDGSSNESDNNGGSNSTIPFLNQTELEMMANMTGITVFLPDPEGMQQDSNSSSNSFNLTNFVFPQVIFNNQSFSSTGNLSEGVFVQQNFTNINGENVTFLFGRNNSLLVNGTEVSRSNILMDNGVLHLLNSTQLFSQDQSFGNGQNLLSRVRRFLKL